MRIAIKYAAFAISLFLLIARASAADSGTLFAAIEKGGCADVEALLAQGADVNAKNSINETPLHYAAMSTNTEVAKLLLKKGAGVNAKDRDGNAPLHVALRRIAELPEERFSATIGSPEDSRLRITEYARRKAMVALLLDKGADANARNMLNMPPLEIALESFARDDGLIKLLLTKGADINAKFSDDSTPLAWATLRGRKHIVGLLLANGADANTKLNDGMTVFDYAVKVGRKDIAKLLSAKQDRLR